ncbi:hypothetical protein BJ741DRAFT_615904 [Chytriomyces cf. hyalinus JEL632]|nr:hypothetical protein BJ741DRAFT_615904 [Chytriomyces cf. hyalinus JEL632]
MRSTTRKEADPQISQIPTTAASDKPPSRQRNFHAIHGGHHSQSQKPDSRDAHLSNNVKQAIVDNKAIRNQAYESDKVTLRTDLKFAIRDAKLIAAVKVKRDADLLRCGFCSDSKEPYKPLGEPIVDSDALLYKSLKIDPAAFHGSSKDKYQRDTKSTIDVEAVNEKHKQQRGSRHDNGLIVLKQKLAQSKKRIHSVKFGIPFTQICDEQTKTKQDAPTKTSVSDAIDWSNLKIDTDKQGMFQNILERHRVAWLEKNSPEHASNKVESDTHMNDGLPSISNLTRNTQERSQKEIEHTLQIPTHASFPETMERFFVTREKFYEQQRQMNQLLEEDLDRLDLDRKTMFVRKYSQFRANKNGAFSEDLQAMRQGAMKQRLTEKREVLRQHEWYFELLAKVSANSKSPLKVEKLLLRRIRGYIEDEQEFSQTTFVQLMRLIPQRLFNEEAIQRIIRFVKQHSSISERDYLEAIELAGHGLVLKRMAAKTESSGVRQVSAMNS